MKKEIEIYDTTLRDGEQQKGICFSLKDKIKIIKLLLDFGIDFIEAGWPGANLKDTLLFKKISSLKLPEERIVAFGMTCKKEKKPKEDRQFLALLEAKTKIITLVGKACLLQVKNVLRTNAKENLRIISESIRFAREKGKRVFFDAEHFFDGFKNNPSFALKVLKTAQRAGAERIVLCDTNGGSLPFEIGKIVRQVKKEIKKPLGIHCHNDSGLALANSLEGLKEGVSQIQGTINGYGERCG
ncbi:MAG: citramalate synthase, partial [Minisyncoccales bacterium]